MSLPTGASNDDQDEFSEFEDDAPIEIPTDLTNDLANFDENDFDDEFDDDFEEENEGEYILDDPGFAGGLGATNNKEPESDDDDVNFEEE